MFLATLRIATVSRICVIIWWGRLVGRDEQPLGGGHQLQVLPGQVLQELRDWLLYVRQIAIVSEDNNSYDKIPNHVTMRTVLKYCTTYITVQHCYLSIWLSF